MNPREILATLAAPFPADAISWRVGSTTKDKTKGMALAYIDARDVMTRLDAVMGADWQCEYVPMPNGTCCCRVGLKIDGEWRWRSNGAVNLSDSDKSDAKEMAEKGSYSDAFKRAAVLWGIGQYLYSLSSPWVALEPRGNSYIIAASEVPKLEALLRRGGAQVAAQTAPAAPAREATAGSPVDPKIAALNKPKAPTVRGPSVRDSAAVRSLLLLALESCKDMAHLMGWGADNGRQSEKWPLMLPADQAAVLKAAEAKLAAVRAADAKAAGADADTGEVAA